MDRRAFLSILAGSPFVFGLRELLAQDPAPDHFAAALKRMKETRRYGVVLGVPATKETQKRLGEGLLARLPIGSKAGREGFELFCANVFICLHEDKARDLDGEKADGEGVRRILLDPDGKRVASDRVDIAVFESAAAFRDSFTPFIHGKDGARLRDHARAMEKEFPENLKGAAQSLVDGTDEARGLAFNLFRTRTDDIAPWLLHKALELKSEPFGPFRGVLWNYYLEQAEKDPEPCLPYGIRVERVPTPDPCLGCGMAAHRTKSNRFLSFYEK